MSIKPESLTFANSTRRFAGSKNAVAGSIKGDVKRKHFSHSAERGWVSDIQPLGCGCHGELMERGSRCDGLK
jgi:hypothetical protein